VELEVVSLFGSSSSSSSDGDESSDKEDDDEERADDATALGFMKSLGVGLYTPEEGLLLKLPQPAQQIQNQIWTRPRKFIWNPLSKPLFI
jgi:hypothetical protein